MYQVQELTDRHQQIIRLTFAGLSEVDIAGKIGVTRETVCAVVNSPMAKAELARLGERAEAILTNVPLQLELHADLKGAGRDALKVNRQIMNDDKVDPRVRSSVGRHFLDRVVFEVSETGEKEGSYREILRRLSDVQRSLGRDVMLLPPVNGTGHDNGKGGPDDGDSSRTSVGRASANQE
jgi:hypothetical protein